MKCPKCNADLGLAVGFDVYCLEDLPDGSPGGCVEEDQYICEQCNSFVSVRGVNTPTDYYLETVFVPWKREVYETSL